MPIFKKKQPAKPADIPPVGRGLSGASRRTAPAEDEAAKLEQEQEIAAIIAVVSARSMSVQPSKIIVRSIVRVSEQATNWNRLTLE
jgi:hypothetical protein